MILVLVVRDLIKQRQPYIENCTFRCTRYDAGPEILAQRTKSEFFTRRRHKSRTLVAVRPFSNVIGVLEMLN